MAHRNFWLRVQGYYRRRAARFVYRKSFLIELQQPLISFTFDDFPRSALLAGGAILNRFGLAATYYASLDLAGKETASGQIFHMDDLTTLFEQGHELACHTFSHCDSWSTQPQTFEASVVKNREALKSVFPDAEFLSFSYPIEMPRPSTKARTAPYFLSCRSGGQTINTGEIDLNQLSAYFLEKSRNNIQPIKDIIDRNQRERGWLIFATHDISDNHTQFGCTPEFFEQVVRYALNSGAHIMPVVEAVKKLKVPGHERVRPLRAIHSAVRADRNSIRRKPLVSILIPAFNAQEWIADTLRSAIAQTWERKEIIVVDDGSTDQTLAIARQFESECVRVVTRENQGAASSRNAAFSLCHGDYIQWLDADDLLSPDKIVRQMAVVEQNGDKRILLSSEFGRFMYQWQRADFVRTSLWKDLTPVEWLLRKMGQNLYMQTATWLVSRELSEAAGLWDTRMLSDDDGEYFCRVLLRSNGTRFVPGAKMYYRSFRSGTLAYLGKSHQKYEAFWLSMRLHIQYLLSQEDSARTRRACFLYLQRNIIHFYPERVDIIGEAEQLARDLGGELQPPEISWKYSWIMRYFGWTAAKNTALEMRKIKWSLQKSLDKAVFQVRNRNGRLAIPDTRGVLPPRTPLQ